MAGNNGGGPWGGSDDGQKTNEPVGSGGGSRSAWPVAASPWQEATGLTEFANTP